MERAGKERKGQFPVLQHLARSSAPEEVLMTIFRLGPDSLLEVILEYEVGSEQLVAELTDNFGTSYRDFV